MRRFPTRYGFGLLACLALPAPVMADTPGEAGGADEARPPMMALELGGAWTRMRHPTVELPTSRGTPEPVRGRSAAARLSIGLHFNLLRGMGRSDLWWTNGVDGYATGHGVHVLVLRPGLEQRFDLSRRLSLGLGAFGAVAEVSLASGRFTENNPLPPSPNGAPTPDPLQGRYTEMRVHDWVGGAGAAVSLHCALPWKLYGRVQVGHTHYFESARRFTPPELNSAPADFRVSLSGPWAGALLGMQL